MIIAGNCSYIDDSDTNLIFDTAKELLSFTDYFRCKIFLGGTSPSKFKYGIESAGIKTLKEINKSIPVMTEIQTESHIDMCKDNISSIWVGARNSQNYGLMPMLAEWKGKVFLKRSPGMTIDEVIGLYDIMDVEYQKEVYIIERGINTFDRLDDSRWSPDLKGVIRLKQERPEIFYNTVIDCSHSVGRKELIEDTYKAFKAIGCEHFMFECTATGESKTDFNHMLSVRELKDIILNDN